MLQNEVKEGDLVQLKSDSASMTVGAILGMRANCYWFNPITNKVEFRTIPISILKKVGA